METKKRGRTENLKPWKPGKSGNPGGRPKRDMSSEIARAVFEGNEEAVYKAMAKALLKGDPRVFVALAERAYGKLRESIEHAVDSNWAAVLEEAQRRLDAYRARTIDVPALPGPRDEGSAPPAAAGSDSLLPAGEPDTWQETRDEGSAQHIPQATPLPAAPAPAPLEKQGEGEREPQEPSQDAGYVDWVSRLGSPGSTRPSGRPGGPHGWMG